MVPRFLQSKLSPPFKKAVSLIVRSEKEAAIKKNRKIKHKCSMKFGGRKGSMNSSYNINSWHGVSVSALNMSLEIICLCRFAQSKQFMKEKFIHASIFTYVLHV